MAYTSFTFDLLKLNFDIVFKTGDLFEQIVEVNPTDFLKRQLVEVEKMPIKSEKARSEAIIFPILLDIRRQSNDWITIYSGDSLNVDKEKGLVGECDFIIAKETQSFTINVPILSVVEAKKQNIDLGIAQCTAQMIGAFKLNEKEGKSIEEIYGCVTTADNWKFLKLRGKEVVVDSKTYYLSELAKVLGIFHQIINQYREQEI